MSSKSVDNNFEVTKELQAKRGSFKMIPNSRLVYSSSIPSSKAPNRNAFAIFIDNGDRNLNFITFNGLNYYKKTVKYEEFGEEIIFFSQVTVQIAQSKYVVLILDQINSSVYLVTFDDLYNQTAQFKKNKLRLNNGFKTIHQCFFQGEKTIVCLGVEGYFVIDFKVGSNKISVTKNKFHKYENFLVKQISDEQIITNKANEVLVEASSGDNIVYFHIVKGVVKMYQAKHSKEAIRSRLFELKFMREPSGKESFERSENEVDDDEIKPENLGVLKVRFLMPMSEFINKQTDYTHINGSFF